MGRKNAMMIGFGSIFVSNTIMGMLSLINYSYWKTFLFLSCLTRFVQGYGDSLAVATAMSIISSNFPDEKIKYISYIGASTGFGLMVGPPLGSFIYGHLGFGCVFYFFSLWIGVMLIIQYFFIPARYNFDEQPEAIVV